MYVSIGSDLVICSILLYSRVKWSNCVYVCMCGPQRLIHFLDAQHYVLFSGRRLMAFVCIVVFVLPVQNWKTLARNNLFLYNSDKRLSTDIFLISCTPNGRDLFPRYRCRDFSKTNLVTLHLRKLRSSLLGVGQHFQTNITLLFMPRRFPYIEP
jgi:hypothetical protein